MAQMITWGLIAEYSDKKLPINRTPKRGDMLSRKSHGIQKISSVIDHDGEIWIMLENGEEESVEELLAIEAK